MAGRGRGMTLPAWMTASGGANSGLAPAVTSVAAAVPVAVDPVPVRSMSTPSTQPQQQMQHKFQQPPQMLQNVPMLNQFIHPQVQSQHYSLPSSSSGPPQMNRFVPPPTAASAPHMAIQQPYRQQYPQQQQPQYQQYPQQQQQQYQQYQQPVQQSMQHQQQYPPQRYLPPSSSSLSAQPTAIDPNNEVSNWSSHETPDGRKYWYNKVTLASTYDKPIVLKTPEERSIQPCKWKEYVTAEGKKYYSDGVESLWEAPEEFKLWKAKIDAIELKKVNVAATGNDSTSSNRHNDSNKSDKGIDMDNLPTYLSKVDATNAFKELLVDKKITATVKMNIVQSLCQDDVRWYALQSAGDKKQALAEYQSKKLKQDKDMQQVKFKKHKESFLTMLAENANIDCKTKWRDATNMLKNDARYKNIEDPHDREEIYNDFIVELSKKEQQDKGKESNLIAKKINNRLNQLLQDKKINSKSNWHDCKASVMEVLRSDEAKLIEEFEGVRKLFLDFIDRLAVLDRDVKRKKRDELMAVVEQKERSLRNTLSNLVKQNVINSDSRWKDVLPLIENNIDYIELNKFYSDNKSTLVECGIVGTVRDEFDKLIIEIRDTYRSDRRLLRDVCSGLSYHMNIATTFSSFYDFIRLVIDDDLAASGSEGSTKEEVEVEKSVDTSDDVTVAVSGTDAEEGEDLEDVKSRSSEIRVKKVNGNISDHLKTQVKNIIAMRESNIEAIYKDFMEQIKVDFNEDLKRKKRREDRYIEVLKEYFYNPEHGAITYEDAVYKIKRHSAYDAIGEDDRQRLFHEYIITLKSSNTDSDNINNANRKSKRSDNDTDESSDKMSKISRL